VPVDPPQVSQAGAASQPQPFFLKKEKLGFQDFFPQESLAQGSLAHEPSSQQRFLGQRLPWKRLYDL
jgi:hypothetical protein